MKAGDVVNPYFSTSVMLLCLILPFLANVAVGYLNFRQLFLFLTTVTLIIVLLNIYSVWRGGVSLLNPSAVYWSSTLTPLFVGSLTIILFIITILICGAAVEQRWLASYPTYFDLTGKVICQIIAAGFFVGLVWLLLALAQTLFEVIKLHFSNGEGRVAFACIVTTLACAAALHITDVQPAVIRSVRSLVFSLLSWLLPACALLLSGFLCCLMWSGLEPLWQTKHAAFLLIAASITLVVLINATFQDYTTVSALPKLLTMCGKVAVFLLIPLSLIAAYSVKLRISQYGATPSRVLAGAVIFVIFCYGFGYLWALFDRKRWPHKMAITNIFNSFVLVITLFSLSSPWLDPARIAVEHQIFLLRTGKIIEKQFDFKFLLYEGARYGIEALHTLRAMPGEGPWVEAIRSRADSTLKLKQSSKLERRPQASVRWKTADKRTVSFLTHSWAEKDNLPSYLRKRNAAKCDGYLVELGRQ